MKYYLKMAILVMGAALAWTIDSRADAVVATVPVGLSPVAIAVDSVTNKIYVGNSGDSSVTVIDGISDSTSTVKMPFAPQGIVVNPITNKIYVGGNNDSLAVLDGLTGKTAIINMGMQYAPQMIVNPVTDKIYVSGNPVLILNGATNSVSELKGQPDSLGVLTAAAIYPAANSIYLLGNAVAPAIGTINGAADSIAWLVATNFVYEAVNPLTGTFYGSWGLNGVVVYLNATRAVSDSGGSIFSARWGMDAIAVNPASDKIYASTGTGYPGSVDSGLNVIDGATNAAAQIGPYTWGLSSMTFNQVTDKMYGLNGSDTVSIVDSAISSFSYIKAGTNPVAIGINSLKNYIYVVNNGSNSVSVINGNIPFTPALSSPANGSLNQRTSVTLGWGTVSGGGTYIVQVSSASNFSSVAFSAAGLTSGSVVASGLADSMQYFWRAGAANSYGTSAWSVVWSFTVTGTAVLSLKNRLRATRIELKNGIISYSLNQECPVDIRIYDILGKKIFELNRVQGSGSYELLLKDRNFPSGVYFLQFKAGAMQKKMKIILPGG